MKVKLQLSIIIITLLVVGVGSTLYKSKVLGFSLIPEEKVTVWTVETSIKFKALGGPVELSFNLPDSSDKLTTLDVQSVATGYSFMLEDERAVWKSEDVVGEQKIYLRATASKIRADESIVAANFLPIEATFSETAEKAAESIASKVRSEQGGTTKTAIAILSTLNSTEDTNSRVLHDEASEMGGKFQMACAVMGKAGIAARSVKGLQLAETNNSKELKTYIEILEGGELVLLNPRSVKVEERETFLLWQKNQESLLEIVGGEGGNADFSVLSGKVAAERVAVMSGKYKNSPFIDFSIYSLPIKEQNTFKLLLLIPIGALVVVILRNLVGIPTSGTFMPILIALVFLQTKLFTGLALFLVVVGVGLILRSYLSHLNLLLVPRISAVLVFVIIIYVAISVTSDKLGISGGMQVTFFPMIIISWTIERMSVLWEEEGPKDVVKQGSGSLFAASLIYFAMSNSYIGHLTYSFPELLLVVLAIIIMIGSYSGYRLTELRRFEPLARKE